MSTISKENKMQMIAHYDSLIDENNDPVHDPKPLRDYMDKWDGQDFIEKMELDKGKSVLEIGIGTGRLAIRVAPLCGEFCGIDISAKTIQRAKENLSSQNNVALFCGDFLAYIFSQNFDIIYSSLTFMHIEEKQEAFRKVANLLKAGGRFILSIDKNQNEYIDMGSRKLKVYPDKPDEIVAYIQGAGMSVLEKFDTEFATIFVVVQNYKNGKWAKQIVSMQNPNGGWGCFHTLRGDSKIPFTTETALSRLELLGYTAEDDCIKNAIAYMETLLSSGELPEGREKSSDFATFVDLIIATRIRRFTHQSVNANKIAEKWAQVITSAFSSGAYSQKDYETSYLQTFGRKPKGGRLIDFVSFYQVSLVCGILDKRTEELMLDYILEHESGIYYVYENRLNVLPEEFTSKTASRYLAAIELLARYESGKEKLAFVYEWLKSNQLPDGTWDMGASAKDGVYFPLSDRWDGKSRVRDCTYRIGKLVDEITRRTP